MSFKRFLWVFMLLAIGLVIPSGVTSSASSHPELGPWEFYSNMNSPRPASPLAVTDEYIYVSGGGVQSQGLPHQDTVERAKLLPNGELGPWEFTSTMTTRRSLHSGASWQNVVYFGGGAVGNFDRLDTVEMAVENGGVLGPFQPTASMNISRVGHSFVRHNDCLYSIGGVTGFSVELSTEVTRINTTTGELIGWTVLPTANNLPRSTFNTQAAQTDTHVYLGQNGGATDPMLMAEFGPNCTLGPWQETGDPFPAVFDAAAIAGDRIYVTGGSPFVLSHPRERGMRVISAEILPDGSLGSWEDEPDLTQERESPKMAVLGPFIYTIGGQVPFNHRRSVERSLLPGPINEPPEVELGNDIVLPISQSLLLSVAITDDASDGPWTVSADFGDGTDAELIVDDLTFPPVFVHDLDRGLFEVSVCVTGNAGGTGCDSVTVSVEPLRVGPLLGAGDDAVVTVIEANGKLQGQLLKALNTEVFKHKLIPGEMAVSGGEIVIVIDPSHVFLVQQTLEDFDQAFGTDFASAVWCSVAVCPVAT